MAVLQTTDGKLLVRRRPAGLRGPVGGGWPLTEWLNQRADDAERSGQLLASYAAIYSTQPVVAAVINKLARQIATLPLKVYRRRDANRRERVTDHPLARLLSSPLPRRGAVNTKQWLIFPTLLHGNALVGKVRETPEGPPVHLLPLDWHHVSAYAQQGQFVEWWSTTQFGDERFIRPDDVVHLGWHGPDGSELGISPLQQLGVTVRLEDAAQRQQTSTFRNGIFPSIAVSIGSAANGGPPNTEMVDLTRASLEQLLKGPDKAFRALLLGPGTDVKPLSMSSRDAELVEQRHLNREEVAMCYDLPPPLIGDLRHATLANVREFGIQLYTDILRPWLTLIEETLQAQLIDSEPWGDPDLYVEFDLSEQLKGEPQELAKTIQVQIASGLMTPNEGRALLNLPPDGDPDDQDNPANKLYLPRNNLQPLDQTAVEVPQLGGPAPDSPQPPVPTT